MTTQLFVSIPFEQGDVFRRKPLIIVLVIREVSIPFEQGDVFRPIDLDELAGWLESQSLSNRAMFFDLNIFITFSLYTSLNPFRTGRCFSTFDDVAESAVDSVSIPFEQGDVFRHPPSGKTGNQPCLNPFRTGRCFSTAAVCWRQESCGLSDPLPNFFGRLRSWLLI